jgi:hypothetical protein
MFLSNVQKYASEGNKFICLPQVKYYIHRNHWSFADLRRKSYWKLPE